ncbi:thioredoxin [Candidatus Pantoea edessiphila]|uniref:Thioredoxin n=1 Tax=Candidatus Pantoea edessiphila TaxID=2044610 RepID=A0A2P5SXF8_9GAMM|nr:thioredoxin TrxA [Candidatus Pantoea edessiphila]MBK4775828.1 thioredoxin TrxA [Pantoea sp. Edef]PPI86982.1 thioredoxin [Candidatus Pantoea edessiphila]
MSSDRIINLNDSNFDETILKDGVTALVDFWADWCGPCKTMSLIIDEIAEEYKDSLIVAKLNVDENPEKAQKYGIRGIPTLQLFKNGKTIATKVGSLSKSQLKDFLDKKLIK